jgi:hypothetical protein
MGRVAPAAALAALLAATAAGCGGEAREAVPADPAPPRASAAPALPAPEALEVAEPELVVPRGFRARRAPDGGVQFAVPRGWIALTRLDAIFPGTVETLGGIDRRVVGPLAALGLPDSPLKALVLGPVRGGRFSGLVTLVVAAAGEPKPYERWLRDATAAVLARLQAQGHVASSRLELPVGKGVRLSFRRTSRGTPVSSVVYLALGGEQVYYLVLTTARPDASLAGPFDVLARSLTLLPGATPAARITGTAGKA